MCTDLILTREEEKREGREKNTKTKSLVGKKRQDLEDKQL